MKHGKKYNEAIKKLDQKSFFPVKEAVELVKQASPAKFDETIDLAVRLGVDPRHADQQVRGAVVLPAGTGRKVRVLVFARGDNEKAALAAGADHVGAEDFFEKIQGGWTAIDVIIATPDMMGLVGRLGRILGPRGLMPNPKLGTVTMDVARAVEEAKAGKIEYRVDKAGNVHVPVGKVSFTGEQLTTNVTTLLQELLRVRPSAAKGRYMISATLSSTMGPGVRLDTSAVSLSAH